MFSRKTKEDTIIIVNNDAYSVIRFRAKLIEALRAHGFRVILATPPGTDTINRKLEELCSQVYYIRMNRWISIKDDILTIIQFALLLLKLRLSSRYHISHIHTMTAKPNILLAPICRIVFGPSARIVGLTSGLGSFLSPLLTHEHPSLKSRLYLKLLRFIYRVFDAMWVQNKDDYNTFLRNRFFTAKQLVLAYGSGVCEPSLNINDTVLSQVLSLASYNNHTYNSISDLQPYIFCCVARAIPEKGLVELVKAAQSLQAYSNIKIILVAPPEEDGTDCLQQLDIPENMVLISQLLDSKLIDAFISFSYACCLPSYYPEGVPRFLIESLAFSKPLITTDHPGCKETINDGQNGILVDKMSVHSLKCAILSLDQLSIPAYRFMCKASAELFKKKFSTQVVLRSVLENLYLIS